MYIVKIFTSIILVLIIIFFFLWLYIRYYQVHGIYFPSKRIYATPDDAGLNYEDINFYVKDGVQINGWYIPSPRAEGTLLFCHGNAGNISHRIQIIKMFHNIDLNVFIFDYRGYGKSIGRPSEQGFYKDALGAYNYLVSKRNVSPNEIIIYGKSIGANVAIDLASKVNTGLLISDGGFCSAIHMSKAIFPFLREEWIDYMANSKLIQSKLKGWLLITNFDALSKIKDIKIPKLIIHSKDDEVIPFNQGVKLFKAAVQPKEFFEMYGGHNEAIFMHMDEYKKRIERFIEKHL